MSDSLTCVDCYVVILFWNYYEERVQENYKLAECELYVSDWLVGGWVEIKMMCKIALKIIHISIRKTVWFGIHRCFIMHLYTAVW